MQTRPQTKGPVRTALPVGDLRPWAAAARERFVGVPLDEGVLVRWKKLRAELEAGNRKIACEDPLIAATALHFNHTLLTGDTAHFAPNGASVLNPRE